MECSSKGKDKDASFKGHADFKMFYSNISSLSLHAKNYLASLDSYDMINVIECHNLDKLQVESFFRENGYMCTYNVAEKLNVLSHGGEALAIKHNYNARPVEKNVLDVIEEQYLTKLRFASMIVSFRGMDILFLNPYLWVSQGFSHDNRIILKQIHVLSKMLGLPFIAIGDFNITFDELKGSEWLRFLQAEVIDPQVQTTTSASLDRPIDLCLISKSIKEVFVSLKPIYAVPWGPHYGFEFLFKHKPLSVNAPVVCVPKPLPLKDFHVIWGPNGCVRKT